LLPRASRWRAQGRTREVETHTRQLLMWTTAAAVMGTLVFEISACRLVTLYLGDAYLPAVPFARLAALGVPFYALFLVLRSTLDASSDRAITTGLVGVSLVCFATAGALAMRSASASGLLFALIVSLVVLAGAAIWSTRRILAASSRGAGS